ncbi:alginate lyase family protein [Mucilaginibacter sp. RB4R14]|uniref:alginate lyase family protein n=1 Tax=Mucilaginibacter aurantiaciroseus TaxID=2949308 RepID=UPI00209052DA|nr:alginate lyase family protein [Mucilaginibacter aurantiaciroseus]MCO5934172.1 alginate lyase family protein [Mucilaginibacter aurantiaciroseus]
MAGDTRKTASLKSLEDANKTYALALVYKYSYNKEYLIKAAEFLTAWAKTNKATEDPINETKLEDMITAYDLIRNDIEPADRTLIDVWMNPIPNCTAARLKAIRAQPSTTGIRTG